MNTQDHSLAPLDMALRRRFRFIDCPPQPELLSTICVDTNADATSPAATIDLAKLLTGINNRIAQTLGAEAQLGHAFLLPVRSLADLQMVLVEQIIPQLAQAAGGQVAVLQYIFDDEQQPIRSQFIHDRQMLIDHQLSGHHLNSQPNSQLNNPQYNSDQHPLFAGQGALFGQSVGAAGYRINADLIAKAGAFSDAAVYQRLYPAGSEL